MQVKQTLKWSAAALMTLSAGLAFGQGIDELVAKVHPNYVTDEMLLNSDKDQNNWMLYGKDYQTTRYSGLTSINQGNVKKMTPVWNMSFGVLDGQDSQAIVVNGTVYVTTSYNKVIAANGVTGEIIWKYERELPGDVYPKLCCDVVNRGVAVYKDKVYLATLDAHIVALHNATGKVLWDKKIGDYTYAETFTLMPMALRGKIIFGTAGAEYGVRGWIAAVNADNGDMVWKTYTIPAKGEPGNDTWAGDSWKYGGGSAWITGSYDAETNNLYWPVGNPGPDFDRHVRAGDNLFTNSNLVLDPDTGKIKSYFQYTPNDPYDYDGVNEMILVTTKGGKKVWLHGSRNGHIYAIDRTQTMNSKAGPIPENKCVWATALGRINFTKPITPANNCKPIYNWPEKDVVYEKVTTDIAPTLDGGKEWHPMSYSHRTNMAYVPVYNFAMDLQAKKMEWKRGEWYLGAKVLNFLAGNGAINAYEIEGGKLTWSRPMSEPATSGTTATAGGLVLFGDARGYVHAVNDSTGESLYSFNVGSGVHGNPTTYAVGGKQYIAYVYGSGGGGIWPLHYADWYKKNNKGGGLMVFTVND